MLYLMLILTGFYVFHYITSSKKEPYHSGDISFDEKSDSFSHIESDIVI